MNDETLPFHQELCVQVVDSDYSVAYYLGEMSRYDNLVTIARVRSNRVFYRQPLPAATPRQQGHPTWYGQRFDLKDKTTWGKPDEVVQTTYTTRRGRTYTIILESWYNLLMSGTRDYPMHIHPFTLIRVRMVNEAGKLVFVRPLWLLVIGQRREELSLFLAWQAYRQRYDVEHFFRFGKQRLLTTAYQTPEVEHEENWWQLTQLAYVQLWIGRSLAERIPQPWERYLPRYTTESGKEASPSEVQRDFARIITEIGTPAKVLKPRGKPEGRAKGERPEQRKRQQVIKKAPSQRQKPKKAA